MVVLGKYRQFQLQHASSWVATLLHLIDIGLRSFLFEPMCFDISFGNLEKKTSTS